jgi:hypothetical protein
LETVPASASEAAGEANSEERICGERFAESDDRTSGTASVAPHLECAGAQESSCLRIHAQASKYPARVDGLFRPHYVNWSEQNKTEFNAPEHLRNVIRIITETGLRIHKELTPMKKDQLIV